MPQMRHCTRCRADAVGLLEDDKTEKFRGCLSACAKLPAAASQERPYVAVATLEGILVNQHLGEAEKFQIWEKKEETFRLVEERVAPDQGGGLRRWVRLSKTLADCRAVLVSGIGETPHEILSKSGLKPLTMNGFIEDGLKRIFAGKDVSVLQARKESCKSCSGGKGAGCL